MALHTFEENSENIQYEIDTEGIKPPELLKKGHQAGELRAKEIEAEFLRAYKSEKEKIKVPTAQAGAVEQVTMKRLRSPEEEIQALNRAEALDRAEKTKVKQKRIARREAQILHRPHSLPSITEITIPLTTFTSGSISHPLSLTTLAATPMAADVPIPKPLLLEPPEPPLPDLPEPAIITVSELKDRAARGSEKDAKTLGRPNTWAKGRIASIGAAVATSVLAILSCDRPTPEQLRHKDEKIMELQREKDSLKMRVDRLEVEKDTLWQERVKQLEKANEELRKIIEEQKGTPAQKTKTDEGTAPTAPIPVPSPAPPAAPPPVPAPTSHSPPVSVPDGSAPIPAPSTSKKPDRMGKSLPGGSGSIKGYEIQEDVGLQGLWKKFIHPVKRTLLAKDQPLKGTDIQAYEYYQKAEALLLKIPQNLTIDHAQRGTAVYPNCSELQTARKNLRTAVCDFLDKWRIFGSGSGKFLSQRQATMMSHELLVLYDRAAHLDRFEIKKECELLAGGRKFYTGADVPSTHYNPFISSNMTPVQSMSVGKAKQATTKQIVEDLTEEQAKARR